MIELSKKSKEFLEQLIMLRDYWLSLNKSNEDTLDGFIFSLCAMFDGESGMNDFKHITLTTHGHKVSINEDDYLHEQYFNVLSEVHNEE